MGTSAKIVGIAMAAATLLLPARAGAQEVKHFRFAYDQPRNTGYSVAGDLFAEKLKELSKGTMGAAALKRLAVQVVDMRGPVEADRHRDLMPLETIQPSIVDQDAVGGDRDRDDAARSRRDGGAGFGKIVEVVDAP